MTTMSHLLSKKGIRDIANRVLARYDIEILRSVSLIEFLNKNQVDVVIDVGANVGQYGLGLRHGGYSGRICSFEPVKACFEKLQQVARNDPSWTVVHSAVGSKEGTVDINVSEFSVFSSIKKINDRAAQFDSRSKTAYSETVPVIRLDNSQDLPKSQRSFLKIDTQGFEQEVLEGSQEVLKRCLGLSLELSVEHLYDAVWTFKEAVAYLDDKGFVPAQFRPVNLSKSHPGSAVEFDCIFRKA